MNCLLKENDELKLSDKYDKSDTTSIIDRLSFEELSSVSDDDFEALS